MRSTGIWWIVAAAMLLLDVYVFQAVKTVSFNASERTFRRDMAKIRHHLTPRNGHRWSVNQVEHIMSLFGRPFEVIEELV